MNGKALTSLLALWICLAAPTTAWAIPRLLNFQAQLADGAGVPIDGSRSIIFALYSADSGGTALWSETHSVTVVDGVVSVLLGSVDPGGNPLPSSAFEQPALYLGVKVGSDPELTPRNPITSVGYAFRAEEVETVPTHEHNSDYLKLSGGILSGEVNVNQAGASGFGGYFGITNSSNGAAAVRGDSNSHGAGVQGMNTGTGHAGYFQSTNSANPADAVKISAYGSGDGIDVSQGGTGAAARFEVTNTGSTAPALEISTGHDGDALSIVATGEGGGGDILLQDTTNSSVALAVQTNGTGSAGKFLASSSAAALDVDNTGDGDGINVQSSSGDSLVATTFGQGRAGVFSINGTTSAAPALYAQTNGTSYALHAKNIGSGPAARFENTSGNASDLLQATSYGTGAALRVTNNSTGNAGEFTAGTGGVALHASSSSSAGTAVHGESSNGLAGLFESTNSASSNHALKATSSGSNYTLRAEANGIQTKAAHFWTKEASNTQEVVMVQHEGSGKGLHVRSKGGTAGWFEKLSSDTGGNALSVTSARAGTSLYVANSSTGTGADINLSSASNPSIALDVTTFGTGRAGFFGAQNTSSTANALEVLATTGGQALRVNQQGSSGKGALFEMYSGSGPTLKATSGSVGSAAEFVTSGSGNSYNALVVNTSGTGHAAHFTAPGSGKGVFVSGSLTVTGAIQKGSGSFVQPHASDPAKEVVYAFFEGPEHAVFLRGTAKLVDGRAVIETPEHFRMVAAEDGISVQFTPRSSQTYGLAAVSVARERIQVEELMGGANAYEFDYFITAKRAGFEAHDPIQPNRHFSADGVAREEFEQRYSGDDMTIRAMRALLIANGILNEDGRLDLDTAQKLGWTVTDGSYAEYSPRP